MLNSIVAPGRFRRARIAWGVFLVAILPLCSSPMARAATLSVCPSGCEYSVIQAAIDAASSGDVIQIAPGIYIEHLLITKDVILQGADSATTIIAAPPTPGSVIAINGSTVVMGDLTITGGSSVVSGAGIYNEFGTVFLNHSVVTSNAAQLFGGGIGSRLGTLTITHSVIRDNTVESNSSQVVERGGGVWSEGGVFTMSHSTVRDNASAGDGGGLWLSGTNAISGSTVSGNTARSQGGAIYNSLGTTTLSHSTISGNSAFFGGGIYNRGELEVIYSTITANSLLTPNGDGGGIYNHNLTLGSVVTLSRSIVSGQAANADCNFAVLLSAGYNVAGDTCNLSGTGDQMVEDPFLGPLQDNGGPTLTHAPAPESPVVDAIPAVDCAAVWDQRGSPRPIGMGCDSGSVELADTPESLVDALIGAVEELLEEGVLNQGQGNALVQKLYHVLDKIEAGQSDVAVNQLSAFINQVEAFIESGQIAAEDGAPLIAIATQVIALLNAV